MIDILRGLAALQVCIHHFRNHFYPAYDDVMNPDIFFAGFAFLTGFANAAVMIFFAISGWLVGGKVIARFGTPQFTLKYAIDRASRLWSVLIPAMILSAVIIYFTPSYDARFHMPIDTDILTFLGNLIGLQTIIVNQYAANYPLWSLANETWYYTLFPLLISAFYVRQYWQKGLVILATIICLYYLPYKISAFFSVWILGAIFSQIHIQAKYIKWLFLFMFLGLMTYGRLKNLNDELWIIIAYTIPLLLFLSALQTEGRKVLPKAIDKTIAFLSHISFSLYVLHVPLIYAFQSVLWHQWNVTKLDASAVINYSYFAAMILTSLAITYLFYTLFEKQHLRVRKALYAIFKI